MALFQRLPANLAGRDFIIGDLHGSLQLLAEQLAAVNFDFNKDRLIAVGDLVDRGPNSFDCLCLISQSWFKYVLGNHEAMLLTFLGLRGSNYHRPSDFLNNGGNWVLELPSEQQDILVNKLAPILLEAPVVLSIDDPIARFNVVHAELIGWLRDEILHDADLSEDTVANLYTNLTWGRRMARSAAHGVSRGAPCIEGIHIASDYKERGLSLTYVGHTIMRAPVLYRSHVYIDRGAYENSAHSELFMVEHRRFASQLKEKGLLS